MPSENEELLSKISQLAGQINRHRTAAAASGSSSRPQQHQSSYPARHQPYPTQHPAQRGYGSNSWTLAARGAPNYRGRGRGSARMPTHGHRNRTLVLNSAPTSGNSSRGETPNIGTDDEPMADVNDAAANPASASNGTTTAAGPSSSGSWVAKRDRHMQLINSSVYDQHLQNRAKAIEQTRQDKLKRKEEREKSKLRSFLQGSKQYGIVNTIGRVNSKPTKVATYQHEIVINGARYKITVDGSKLVKVSDDAKKPTPKTAVVGGVTFYRDLGAENIRIFLQSLEAIPCSRHTIDAELLGESCKGKCVRGNTCPYVHDPDRVAICPKFLQNSCPDGDSCDLSHIPNPHRVPACVHFLRGNCSNENCKYSHIRVNPSAPICRPFAKEGYCDKGAECLDKHIFECPDFDAKGVCNDKACKLPHIEHAGRRRAAAAAAAKAKPSGEDSDVSSDEDDEEEEEEEEQFGSDDVDSDYFSDNEVILQTSDDSHEVSQQADFIRF
ncbi:hypothetical protein H072_7689 [Dactylellina haptotyla CBS 200.50]|uniref:C3H1-type domain-containing protein n=1 Tax=Dactylellina haptotyla (strain CBS 200.50) TaxID=1284197 RepID=S8A6A0_DACHA|nr:hypothetical protein H072_7689 [Dactylellina haptotyla CBS 200.50]